MDNESADLALRERVATLDGYHDFTTHIPQNRISAREPNSGRFVEIPYYELSLDAISEACDRHNIGFDLEGFVDDKEGYKYVAKLTNDDSVGCYGFTRAIAVCHLFAAVMTERLARKEEVVRRDRLGRKIAEEALERASQHPDFKRDYPDLDLRQKVATLIGWTDIYCGESQQELWGEPPLGASTTGTKVPHYELDVVPIVGALISANIMYKRLTLCDDIDIPNKNVVYEDHNASIVACGKTPAIALCNLFVAVMESRPAANNFDSRPELTVIREELVKVKAPFTREISKQIKEKALNSISEASGTRWNRVFEDLAIAADRVDAMLARQELDEGVEVK